MNPESEPEPARRLSVRWRRPTELDDTPLPVGPPGSRIDWMKSAKVTLVEKPGHLPLIRINRWAPRDQHNCIVTVFVRSSK